VLHRESLICSNSLGKYTVTGFSTRRLPLDQQFATHTLRAASRGRPRNLASLIWELERNHAAGAQRKLDCFLATPTLLAQNE